MERNERVRLESVRNQLRRNLRLLDQLLQHAPPPRHRSISDIKRRATNICRELAALRRPATPGQLRAVVTKHGMPYTAVGALYAGGYLRRSGKGIVLGARGTTIVKGS
jgi:hypothetical protein